MTNYFIHKCYVRQPLNYWLYGELDLIAGRTNISPHHRLNFQKVVQEFVKCTFFGFIASEKNAFLLH
jgi:hypothetical protein